MAVSDNRIGQTDLYSLDIISITDSSGILRRRYSGKPDRYCGNAQISYYL